MLYTLRPEEKVVYSSACIAHTLKYANPKSTLNTKRLHKYTLKPCVIMSHDVKKALPSRERVKEGRSAPRRSKEPKQREQAFFGPRYAHCDETGSQAFAETMTLG